jgi:tetratricopeptide (TPR) repeat protein
MRNHLASTLDVITNIVLLLVAGLIPLLFLNQTTEFYDMPKLVTLIVATVVLLGLSIVSWIVKGKITITRTPLDLPLVLFLVIVLISTFLSGTRLQAIYGDFPSVHGSAISWVVYILLYFLTVSNLKNPAHIRNFLYVLYASAAVVAVLTLSSFFGAFLPFDFAQAVNFTPTGSTFSTVALLMLLLPLPLLSILKPNKYLPSGLAVALSVLFGLTIAFTGSVASYAILFCVFVVVLVLSRNYLKGRGLTLFLVPSAVVVLALLLAYMPFPGNKIQQLETAFPKEVQLPLSTSWKISASTFRDAPFFGTGPSTYLFNFTSYKPAEFNLLNFWNFTFRSASNEFLHVLGTLGLLGFCALILLCLSVIKNSGKLLFSHHDHENISQHVLLTAFAVSGLVSVVLLAVHATTLISVVMTLFVLAILMMSQESIRNKETEFSMGIKAITSQNKQFDLLPVVIFIIFLVGAVALLAKTYTAVLADYYHRQALAQSNKNGTLTYQYLQKAETLNPLVDLYRVDMAQTNFALANAIAVQKGPSKDNPQGSLTDKDKQTIQTLLSQAINEGRASVALSPRSSRNWEVLASIYRNITGVAQNALTFSLDAYGRAIQRNPLDPTLRFSVGQLYYAIKNYDMSIRFFTDAVNLKPDYVNAYYNLALAYREKGDLQSAQLVANQTLTLIKKETNPQDYDAVSKLIADLKTQIDKAQANKANTPNTGLNNSNLPNVNVPGLNNPPNVATPSAIQQNPSAKVPAVSITPTATPTRVPFPTFTPVPTSTP